MAFSFINQALNGEIDSNSPKLPLGREVLDSLKLLIFMLTTKKPHPEYGWVYGVAYLLTGKQNDGNDSDDKWIEEQQRTLSAKDLHQLIFDNYVASRVFNKTGRLAEDEVAVVAKLKALSSDQIIKIIQTLVEQCDFSPSATQDAVIRNFEGLLSRLDSGYQLSLKKNFDIQRENFDTLFLEQWQKNEDVDPQEWLLDVSQFADEDMSLVKAELVSQFMRQRIPSSAKVSIVYNNQPITPKALSFIFRISMSRPLDLLSIKNANLGDVFGQFVDNNKRGDNIEIRTRILDISYNDLDYSELNKVTKNMLFDSFYNRHAGLVVNADEIDMTGNFPYSFSSLHMQEHFTEYNVSQVVIKQGKLEATLTPSQSDLEEQSQFFSAKRDRIEKAESKLDGIEWKKLLYGNSAIALLLKNTFAKPNDPIPEEPPFDDDKFTYQLVEGMLNFLKQNINNPRMAEFSDCLPESPMVLLSALSYLSGQILSHQIELLHIAGEEAVITEVVDSDYQWVELADVETDLVDLNLVQAAKDFEFSIKSGISPFAEAALEGLASSIAGLKVDDQIYKEVMETLSEETQKMLKETQFKQRATKFNETMLTWSARHTKVDDTNASADSEASKETPKGGEKFSPF
jgi:hypothetical protein